MKNVTVDPVPDARCTELGRPNPASEPRPESRVEAAVEVPEPGADGDADRGRAAGTAAAEIEGRYSEIHPTLFLRFYPPAMTLKHTHDDTCTDAPAIQLSSPVSAGGI